MLVERQDRGGVTITSTTASLLEKGAVIPRNSRLQGLLNYNGNTATRKKVNSVFFSKTIITGLRQKDTYIFRML